MQIILGNRDYINNCVLNKKINIITNEYGKPYYEKSDIYFNKSHTDLLSTLIIDDKECGIDIECIRKYNKLMVNKVFSEAEISFLDNVDDKDYYFTLLWVLKEAYLKCIGVGISVRLKDINFIKDNNIILDKEEFIMNYINLDECIIGICRRK